MSISIDSCLGKQSVRAFLFLPLLLAMTVGILANEHWPRFRGSSGRSVEGDDPRLPSVWGKDTNRVWTATVPGMGWSSPIIWGERVFVTSVINDEEFERPKAGLYLGRGIREPQKGLHHWLVSCLSLKSGELLWSKEV